MDKYDISIIIPVYNAEETLQDCINSIIKQTFKNYEIVLVNDGSTDTSGSLCESFSRRFANILAINQDNRGANKARQAGINAAKGTWITFVDADDTLPDDALHNLYSETSDTDIVVGFFSTPPNQFTLSLEEARHQMIIGGQFPPCPWAKLYRKKIINDWCFDFPREILYGEDMIMNMRILFNTKKAPRFVFKCVYNYIWRENSISHSMRRSLNYEAQYDYYRLNSIPESEQYKYLKDISSIRLNGLLCVAISDCYQIASHSHPYLTMVAEGIRTSRYNPSLLEKTILKTRSTLFVKLCGYYFIYKNALIYRIKKLL